MRTNSNVDKVIGLIQALQDTRYQTAQDLAGVTGNSLEFVYAWCRELVEVRLVEVRHVVNYRNRTVRAWRWRKQ
jgi:hypothetical protein